MFINVSTLIRPARPNILFFLPDQLRPDWLGYNREIPLRTPHIDRLCAEGTRFTRAFTPSPLCAPARACLASGRDYEHCGVSGNRENFPLDLPTYYQHLRAAGYLTCGVGKFDLHKDLAKPLAELDWGLDGSRLLAEWGFSQGIDNEGKMDGSATYRAAGRPKGPYMRYLHEKGLAEIYLREHAERKKHHDAYVTALPEEAYCDNWLSENGLEFLRNFPKDQPWHLVINFVGPHSPMDVTQRMHDAWKDEVFPLPIDNGQEEIRPDDHQRIRQHYAAMIENIDRQVGRFIDAVKERGELENTLIVFASDHGEMLGDFGKWGKGTWRSASTGIPLIVAGPGITNGVQSDALVSLQDLAATFLEYAGAQPLPGMSACSLRPVLGGRATAHRPHILSGLADWRMIFDGRFKLIQQTGEPPRLFDLESDPHEHVNIAEKETSIVERLAQTLAEET